MPKVPEEIVLESYTLRSTFFLNKLESLGFFNLYEDMKKIAFEHESAFSWDNRSEWNINEEAWGELRNSGIDPLLVFAHPNILKLNPSFLRYYRSIAQLPQKGLIRLCGLSNVNKIEESNGKISENKIIVVVKTINNIMSLLVKLTGELDESRLIGMMYATAGTTIDGSWRNAIGAEGERVIRTIILKSLLKHNEVVAFIDKKGKSTILKDWEGIDSAQMINVIKSFTTTNGSSVHFSSEPDIELFDSQGNVLGAIEIKAGLDPAGALERLGAMFKSFENTLAVHPNAQTILVASCITNEVSQRLNESRSIGQLFILTDVINNKKNREDIFCNTIRSILKLVDKRM